MVSLQPWKQKAHRLLAVGMPVNTVRLTGRNFQCLQPQIHRAFMQRQSQKY